MNIPFHKLTPRHLLNLAPLLSLVSSVLTYAGTESFWLALAVAFICLTLHTVAMALVWQIAVMELRAEEAALDHHKVAMPEPRRETGDRYAAGYCLPHVLLAFTGVLLFIPLIAFIVTALMGAEEPRW